MRRKYWIKYTNGSLDYFYAMDHEDAYKYFMLEGDHAVDYGYVAEELYSLRESIYDSN